MSQYQTDIEYLEHVTTIKWNQEAWERWQALRQDKGECSEWAGFTCIKCPQPYPNHLAYFYNNDGHEESEWINTKRCKICKSKQNKFARFEKWFEDLYWLALRTNREFFFLAVTKDNTRFRGTAEEIIEESIDQIKYIKKTFGKILREDPSWKKYNDGLIVGELKWRRPGKPVYATGKQEWFISKHEFGETWGRTPIRFSEQYEAHPHVHYIGLKPKSTSVDGHVFKHQMDYPKLLNTLKEKNMGGYIEQIPLWRAMKYLKRYLYKDEATYPNGKKARIRDRVGQMYNMRRENSEDN